MFQPFALVKQPLLRRVDQIRFVERAVLHDAEIVEYQADIRAFGRGQGEIVRPCRCGQLRVVKARVVAVALQAFGQQDVAVSVAHEIPQRRERRCAAAEDKGVAAHGARRVQGKAPFAQDVAEGQAGAVYADRRHGVEMPPNLP